MRSPLHRGSIAAKRDHVIAVGGNTDDVALGGRWDVCLAVVVSSPRDHAAIMAQRNTEIVSPADSNDLPQALRNVALAVGVAAPGDDDGVARVGDVGFAD